MRNYWVILKAAVIVAILVVLKLIVDHLRLDIIETNPVVTSLVAGVIFTLAIMFSGILSDYKEGEKIPGEIAAAIRNLHKDINVAALTRIDLKVDMQGHVRELLKVLIANFDDNHWKLREIKQAMDRLDEDIEHLAADGIAPAFIVKIRSEMSSIEKIAYRVDTIMETSFLPSAYIIAIVAACAVIGTLLFTKMDPYYVALTLFGTAAFVLVSLLLLIRDMDNPFDFNSKSSAHVDLAVLFKLDKELNPKE